MLTDGPENTLGGGLIRLAQLAASVHRYESAVAMANGQGELEIDETPLINGQDAR